MNRVVEIEYRGLCIEGLVSDYVRGTQETAPEDPECVRWSIRGVDPDTDILESMNTCPQRIAEGFLRVTGRFPECIERWIEDRFSEEIENECCTED